MVRRSLVFSFSTFLPFLIGGCAMSGAHVRAASAAPPEVAVRTVPPPLERSLFERDPGGQISEDAIQHILDAPIEIDLPARVGVLPILTAGDWRGPAPDYLDVPQGASAFAHALGGSEPFSMVTEVMPIPSGATGMEALRQVAARYRLRYLVLYREVVEKRARSNGLAALYATVLGAFFLPGQTLGASGYVEASLFDVKTGLLLCTVRRDVSAKVMSNVWHQDDKLASMQTRLAVDAAPRLSQDLRLATTRFAEAARIESKSKEARALTAARGN